MNKISMDRIKELMENSIKSPLVNHYFLDRRWREDGLDGRNKHYRRPYYRFCTELADVVKANFIVELGIDEGDCSGHFALGRLEALVVGIDIHKDGEEPSKKCVEVAHYFPNFVYRRGWTWNEINYIKSMQMPIDILFIDSWHEFDYFAKDWNDYAPYLGNNSVFLMDDLQYGELNEAFNQIPGKEKYVDKMMNSAVPFGVIINPDKNFKFVHKKRDYMP